MTGRDIHNTFIGVNLIPDNEEERLQKLKEYEILDTPQEGAFNHIAAMATHMFKVPIALISLVDADRVWFKANVGLEGVRSVPRGESLCSLAVLNSAPTIFQDAANEPCLLANPLVSGNFGLRFYAGAPLVTADGLNIGTMCLIDKQPREFTESDQKMLVNLASIVMDEIELRYLRRKVSKDSPE
ncbi:GAF domain-containing protein [Pontibacter ummariensis]|uniref:GAF domain-containing protein n=1 Tax=Pontibacter ummariensis TaxID=1610492 RepID=A0A239GST9_9BACT|nr:GAF domain-containing protein [Pontibacter ummariensis]SNS72286.1 GAF domain-containing protein [Pontibacter ummariensis]